MDELKSEIKITNLQFYHEGCTSMATHEIANERNSKFHRLGIKDAIFCAFCNQVWKLNIVPLGDLDELQKNNK